MNPKPSCFGIKIGSGKISPRERGEADAEQIELENRVLLEKMSKIMRMDPGDARSCHGGHHTEQFPFRSILQIKPGIRVDMTQYPMIDRYTPPLISHHPPSLFRFFEGGLCLTLSELEWGTGGGELMRVCTRPLRSFL